MSSTLALGQKNVQVAVVILAAVIHLLSTVNHPRLAKAGSHHRREKTEDQKRKQEARIFYFRRKGKRGTFRQKSKTGQ